ncbi:hypothetical protein BH10BAC2_BH10BAC2_23970 [soil metagenome]
MVIGKGLVANAFNRYNDDDRYLVFASGVSNSANKDELHFQREAILLAEALQKNKEKIFIYFSTCSLYDPSLTGIPYVKHKLAMEKMINEQHGHYHIFRISNLAGKTNNPHTVVNFFFQHIASGTTFHIWKHAARNIIDIDDAVIICDHIISNDLFVNETINIANPYNYSVAFIIETMEEILCKKGVYDVIEKSSIPEINTEAISSVIDLLNIQFNEGYLQRTLKKYYSGS